MSADTMLMAEKTRPVRLTEDAMKLAKIAASYTGENMSDYVCRVVMEAVPGHRTGPREPEQAPA